jgi:hypothetical protein
MFVELEPVARHVDPVTTLSFIQEVVWSLEYQNVFLHVVTLLFCHVFVW